MPVKLNGATSGSVQLDVPAAIGSDLQLTLPATAGDVVVKAADGSVDLGSVDIDSSGRVGIGTAAPGQLLHLNSSASTAIQISDGTNNQFISSIKTAGNFANGSTVGDILIRGQSGFAVSSNNGSSVALRIDSSGRLLVGTSSAQTIGNSQAQIEASTDSSSGYALSLNRSVTDIYGPQINFRSTRGTAASPSTVNANDQLGSIAFYGYDGTDSNHQHASIAANVDGTPGSNDCPGRLVFSTTADGASSPTERMRITSSGNVGIGVSNPVQQSGIGLHINNSSGQSRIKLSSHGTPTANNGFDIIYETSNEVHLLNHEAAALKFGTNDAERLRIDSSGKVDITTGIIGKNPADNFTLNGKTQPFYGFNLGGTASAPTSMHGYYGLAFGTLTSERMRIDSSGRVGIGTTSPAGKLTVYDGSSPYLYLQNSTSGTSGSDGFSLLHSGVNTFFANRDSGYMAFETSNSERMRIDSSGNISSFANSGSPSYTIRNASTAGTSTVFIQGLYSASSATAGGAASIYIFTNGNVQNTNNSYGAISDARLKENIIDASSQWDDIKALQVRNYNFIEGQTHTQLGVVAQEVETVSPGLVTESPDTDDDGNDLGTTTKSVNYSVLYMKAVKALQEAMERIETLETKVASLEANS